MTDEQRHAPRRRTDAELAMLQKLFVREAAEGSTIFHQAHAEELLSIANELIALRSDTAPSADELAAMGAALRNAALEEAARVCDEVQPTGVFGKLPATIVKGAAEMLAVNIRALKNNAAPQVISARSNSDFPPKQGVRDSEPAVAAPECVVVPREPTQEMLYAIVEAFRESDYGFEYQMTYDGEIAADAYKRMLAAAPSSERQSGPPEER